MGRTALEIGANVFQFFTRNPRGGSSKPFDPNDAARLVKIAEENNFGPLLAHAPYTLNPCAADEDLRKYAGDVLADDIFRMDHFPGAFLNFHPGSHVKQGAEVGIQYISEMLNRILKPTQKDDSLARDHGGQGLRSWSQFSGTQGNH